MSQYVTKTQQKRCKYVDKKVVEKWASLHKVGLLLMDHVLSCKQKIVKVICMTFLHFKNIYGKQYKPYLLLHVLLCICTFKLKGGVSKFSQLIRTTRYGVCVMHVFVYIFK